eukprot:CAMPEP_0196145216 /NCGR_PEP_ID=MMETSP0910-20130528/19560_1 /TAXON_ID=49265 /ORGANISM="Thalassiosira rotula, Strain GSO102" /LENGTH=80 /DNA_ID=CAMNT_0041407109 /DNA_START=57 /DNA_END=296 /DNA_ORIENTATION=+
MDDEISAVLTVGESDALSLGLPHLSVGWDVKKFKFDDLEVGSTLLFGHCVKGLLHCCLIPGEGAKAFVGAGRVNPADSKS